jgi:uncharacterized protein YybS (DUF2232 family)
VAFPGKDAVLAVAKGGAATVILFVVYLAVPILGMFSGIAAPFPALFYGLKRGMGTAAAIVAVSAAVIALLELSGGAMYLLQGGIVSLALAAFLRRKTGGARAVALTTAVNVGIIAAGAAIFSAVRGVNLHALVVKGIEGSIARTVELYQKSGLSGEDLETARDALKQSAALIGKTYPAFLVIGIATVAGINLFLAMRNREISDSLSVGTFRSYRNTDLLVWVLIAGGFMLAFGTPVLEIAGLNMVIVALSLYLLQGLAVISWFFERYTVSRLLRVIFYIFFAVQPFLAIMVALLGLFDLWANFRAPKISNL